MILYINGQKTESPKDKKLLSFLRDDLKFTSVKDGCSEGACGTCMVIADGKAIKACTRKLSQLEGKNIITAEGLSEHEKHVYADSFAKAGAVQCGFCIPGMIMSAKALLDSNPQPDRQDIKQAIKGNICRCTGYIKIEKAILNAAKIFREGGNITACSSAKLSGNFERIDAKEKVLGSGIYCDDLVFDNMIYAKALRSQYPRAVFNKINKAKAENHPDCVKILTAKDVPNNKIGHVIQDWDVMIPEGSETRYIGDAIALVAGRKKETLDELLSLIEIDYTPLPPITSTAAALDEEAPLIHPGGNIMSRENLQRGNAEEAISNSKYTVSCKYYTPAGDHAFMEPECAIALPNGDDGLSLYTGSQSIYDEQHEISSMLRIKPDKIHIMSTLIGGGFGGKEDMSVQHHAALMAWHTKLPVKVKFSRQESLNCHPKRHAMEMEFTTACDENGMLTALKAVIIADTGAYASLGGPVMQRACTHAAGPYNYQNIDITGLAVYTNNIVAGAYRGFGVTQVCFAIESNLNLLAEKAGISPWEIRYKNAIRPGQTLPNGQKATPDCALTETLEAVKDIYHTHPRAGIACAFKNCGKGVGMEDIGRCILSVEKGKIHIRTSAACMGQGLATMCIQMVCETSGLHPSLLIAELPDTSRTPDSGTSTSSRQTVVTGEATVRAAKKLAEALKTKSLPELEGMEFYEEYSAYTDPMGAEKDYPVSHVAYSYATQVVMLDEKGKVEKVVASYDVGTPVNMPALEGQIEGGVTMGLGFALTENFITEGGYPKTKFATLGLLRSTDIPDIEIIIARIPEERLFPYAYGAKGVGELCLIPAVPAAAHAYYRLDGRFRNTLPLRSTYYNSR